ncbi:MAG: DUF4251 domain-containing protein [Tannerellaceae bacterium]|nr:DUF4251 domain-containing protein [Tannerellaceae bacterium]
MYVRLLVLGMVVLLSGVQPLSAQTKKDLKVEKEQLMRELVDDDCFHINVDRAIPQQGGSKYLTSPYSLEVCGESVKSYLPYFGRAYSVPYGGGKGLIFDSTITGYQRTYDSKGNATIKFNTRTDEDNYKFQIEIFTNGSATISVVPVNRQAISFHGEVTAPVTY